MSATPRQLGRIHQAIATRTFLPHRAADIARDHLERPLRDHLPPGVTAIGYKGGSLPGVLAAGMSVRRDDGSIAAGALLAHGGITAEQLASGDPALAMLKALNDPAWRDQLVRALHG